MTCVNCKHFDGFDAIRSTLINCDLYDELSTYDAEDMCLGFEEKEKVNKMMCPECGKKFNVHTRYNPTTRKSDLPYTTYMHTYSLNQALKSGVCKNSIKVNK